MKGDLLIQRAAELDQQGFLPFPGETPEAFLERFEQSEKAYAQFQEQLDNAGTARLFEEFEVRTEERIPDGIIAEAAEKTKTLYGFENTRVPGFFLSGKLGALWGGCMIGDPDNGFAVMLLRSSFRDVNKWYLYERSELIAHELCHAMRQSLCDVRLEEYFAYQTGSSFLRRNFGNCFIREIDAVLFILPTFLLLGATVLREFTHLWYPLWPFWCLAAAYPLFLLLRNFSSLRKVHKAEKKLRLFGVEHPEPILFRSTFEEISAIGTMENKEDFQHFLEQLCSKELRWAIIKLRFFDQEEQEL